jgi:hypothetical protein
MAVAMKSGNTFAERMIECARGGGTTLGELDAVARRALLNLTQKRSA